MLTSVGHVPAGILLGPKVLRRASSFWTGLGLGSQLRHGHKERRLLQYPQAHVYNVVSNVEDYKHFVPWCVDSRVLLARPGYMEAELAVGFNIFSERYLSRVTLDPMNAVVARAVETQLFHYLTNEWTFAPGPDPASTWLAFSVDFQFRSILYAQASHLFFDEVVNKMVAAFERRCAVTWDQERARQQQQVPGLARHPPQQSRPATVMAPAQTVGKLTGMPPALSPAMQAPALARQTAGLAVPALLGSAAVSPQGQESRPNGLTSAARSAATSSSASPLDRLTAPGLPIVVPGTTLTVRAAHSGVASSAPAATTATTPALGGIRRTAGSVAARPATPPRPAAATVQQQAVAATDRLRPPDGLQLVRSMPLVKVEPSPVPGRVEVVRPGGGASGSSSSGGAGEAARPAAAGQAGPRPASQQQSQTQQHQQGPGKGRMAPPIPNKAIAIW